MQKQAPTLGKLLVMVGFTLSCFGLLLYLWVAFGGSVPFASQGYRFTIPLREAGLLAEQADVRISGVNVGKVTSIELEPNGRTTNAVVELDERYAPIPRDSRAITRQKTLLGETYLEITPGTPGKNNAVPEGGSLRPANVAPSVELDEILRTFDPRTRADFQAWMQGLALSVSGRGRDLSEAIGNLSPTAQDGTELLTILNNQQTAVSRLVANTGVVFDALGQRGDQLRQLIDNSNQVFSTTADRNEQLRQIFQILPTFETESTTTLRALDAFTRNADPLVTQLRPAVRQLSPTLVSLKSLAPDLRSLFAALGPLIDAGQKGLPATDQVLNQLRPVLGQLDPFLRNLNPVLQGLGFYKPELTAFFANAAASTQATEKAPGSTTRLHYLRSSNPLNLENLTSYPQRPGSNRPNAYTYPGVIGPPPNKRPVFENRQCGRGIPRLLTQAEITAIAGGATTLPGLGPVANLLPPGLPAAELPSVLTPTLLGILDSLVWPQGPTTIVAPACTPQSVFPSIGKGSTTSSDYPHLFPDPVPNPDVPVATPASSIAGLRASGR